MSGKASKKARQAARSTAPTYWHGGRPGLSVGTILVSRADAKAHRVDTTQYDQQEGYALGVTKPNRVYFSSEREFARGFAALLCIRDSTTGVVHQRGALYEVQPIGSVKEDSDFAGQSVSWCAPQARITRVVEKSVALNDYAATERIGPHLTWTDGSPLYNRHGEYLPSPEQIAAGVFPVWQDTLPAWTPLRFVRAWLAGQPSGDRPDPTVHPNVAIAGREAHEALLRQHTAIRRLSSDGLRFIADRTQHLDQIKALLPAAAHTSLDDDGNGVAVATHPREGVVAALVFTAEKVADRITMFIREIGVAPTWCGRGIGSVLVHRAQLMLPRDPDLVAGRCEPHVAPFFASNGFTVLHPGTPLPIPTANGEWSPGQVAEDHSWFFRQGAY